MYNYIVNNRVIIGIIILVLLLGIGFIVSSNRRTSTNPPVTTAPLVTESSTPQASASSEITQEQSTITLTSSGFSPGTLTIKAKTTVTWVNKSGTDAAVNSSPHPQHTDYPPLNLGIFPDGSILSLAFDKAGTYKYHNHLSPTQFGTIIVQ